MNILAQVVSRSAPSPDPSRSAKNVKGKREMNHEDELDSASLGWNFSLTFVIFSWIFFAFVSTFARCEWVLTFQFRSKRRSVMSCLSVSDKGEAVKRQLDSSKQGGSWTCYMRGWHTVVISIASWQSMSICLLVCLFTVCIGSDTADRRKYPVTWINRRVNGRSTGCVKKPFNGLYFTLEDWFQLG